MLPSPVDIREVGPRDGFQNEPEIIPTEAKVDLIDRLARTKLVTSRRWSPVRAELREVVDERKLRFDVEVTHGERTIGVGTHERRIIRRP